MNISIKDIARHCNLNPSTVSRALNNKYGVKPETKKRVMDAARELGYVPSLSARELVKQEGNLIGIIIPESDAEAQPAFFAMLPYINKKLSAYGMETIIYAFDPYRYINGELNKLIQKRRLRGCIIMPGFMKEHKIYEDIRDLNTPSVVMEVTVQSELCSSIHTDEVYGAYQATKHLISNGHSRIGFINGPEYIQICEERREGFEKALHESGILIKSHDIIYSDFSGNGGGAAVLSLLDQAPDLTAVFCANDLMAMGAVSTLAEHGYCIPRDLSIVGFDGMFIGAYYNPPLTTVQNDDVKLGLQAAESLIRIIEEKHTSQEWIKPELIIRKSVQNILS